MAAAFRRQQGHCREAPNTRRQELLRSGCRAAWISVSGSYGVVVAAFAISARVERTNRRDAIARVWLSGGGCTTEAGSFTSSSGERNGNNHSSFATTVSRHEQQTLQSSSWTARASGR